jgi:hypothetical protein
MRFTEEFMPAIHRTSLGLAQGTGTNNAVVTCCTLMSLFRTFQGEECNYSQQKYGDE